MRKFLKLFGILLLALVIGFTVFACTSTDNSTENSGNNNSNNSADNNGNDEKIIDNTPDNPKPFRDIDALDLVKEMRVGWNLGNTFDSSGGSTVFAMETAWISPKKQTTKENITALKEAGFNIIRIPVSWNRAVDKDYTIREDFMARVTEVVDYAVDNDMFIIINSHHDENIFKFMNSNTDGSIRALKIIWAQIAINFKDYDEKLMFEGLNEPRTKGSSAEWSGGTAEERANLNTHYQAFVDTVRACGSNNSKRFLLINPYAASGTTAAMNGLELPLDTAEKKLIVSYHVYAPYDFALNVNSKVNTWSQSVPSDVSSITNPINQYYNKYVTRGIPVIIGEFGAMNKNNEDTRAEWAEFYVKSAKEKGMPCIWWDNGATTGNGELFGLLNRADNTFIYPKVVAGLMKGSQ